jgi:hypothetical protein
MNVRRNENERKIDRKRGNYEEDEENWPEGEAYILIRILDGRQYPVRDILQYPSLIAEGWQMLSIR